MSPDTFEIPDIELIASLLPAFQFEHLIEQGSSCAVFKARHLSLERDVAIKIFTRELGKDPLFSSTFEAGAKSMARLSHPSLIRVYDFGDLDGMPYIVMEYVPGKSLHRSAHGKAIDPKQAVEIVVAVCNGLAHAHAHGVIHGHIKSTDILLTPKCEPKIRQDVSTNESEENSPQSVVFSLGVMLRELLTGVPAEAWDTTKPAIPDLGLSAIYRKAIHPDPALRYADVSSFAEGLTRWLLSAKRTPLATTAKPPTFQQRKPVPMVRSGNTDGWSLLRNCAIIAILLFSIHLTWSVLQFQQERIVHQQQEENAKPKIIIVKTESNEQALARMSQDAVIVMDSNLVQREN